MLRSQRGLTYGASADLETYKNAGGIVAETDTRTEATAEVLRLAVDEFYRLQRERVYDGELEGAQAYLAGHFPLTIETPDAIATQVLNHLFYEIPLDELQNLSRSRAQHLARRCTASRAHATSNPIGWRSCSSATPTALSGT